MPNQQSDAEPFHTLCDAFEWYFTHLRIERRPQTPDERREFIRNFLGIKKREAQPVNRDIPDAIASLIACTPAPVTDAEVDAADSTFGDITKPIPNPALAAMERWLCKHGGQPWFMVMTALFPHVSHSDRSSGQRAAVAWLAANDSPGNIRSFMETMRAAGLEVPAAPTHANATPASHGPARVEVVLWEGAAHTERNVRLARTRSAYLESHGNVIAALKALDGAEHRVARSTFYDHLAALDRECPSWRQSVMVSGASGNPDHGGIASSRWKTRGNGR